MANMQHGGALDRAIFAHGGSREDWLDLSTGINPNPYPIPDMPDHIWQRLPDESLMIDCLAAARAYYGVPDHMEIVAAPGTQAIIQLLPYILGDQNVAIVSPTYNEHANCWAPAGADIAHVPDLSATDSAMCIIVNPNNPTGVSYYPEEIVNVGYDLDRTAGRMIIDEAFCDVQPWASIVPQMLPNMVVLKSFGKFFGLAGLRLGFAIAPKYIADNLAARLGPWAVSAPALFSGAQAMRDRAWIDAARTRLTGKRACVENMLVQCGFKIVGATDLFITTSHVDSASIAKSLLQDHILVRVFDYEPSWIRFGLPKDDLEFQRLELGLSKAMRGK